MVTSIQEFFLSYLMRLVSASLQTHVSKTIEFFQIHEEDAALHASIFHLGTLETDTIVQNSSVLDRTQNLLYQSHQQMKESLSTVAFGFVSYMYASYPLLGSVCFEILDLTHDCGQILTRCLVQQKVLLSIPGVQLSLLIIYTNILDNSIKV